MIIAIPASADNVDALIDERFARCSYFCFYNTESSEVKFRENEKKDISGGLGPQVAEFLAVNGVNEVWSLEVGPKAQNALNKLNIRIRIVNQGQTIQQLINDHVF